jgi:SAM-dependent methyltransferase
VNQTVGDRDTAGTERAAGAAEAAALFEALERINEPPALYSRYTADALWTSPDISEMLLRFHLDGEVDVASRRSEFMDASVDWISATFDLGPGKRVIDLGCGPGLYLTRLARTGAKLTGVDFSARSIDYARAAAERDGLAIDYVLGDYLALDMEPGDDLAMMIMCDYCALSPQQRRRLLERIGRLLGPGGAFLFDVYSYAGFETWEEQVAYGADLMDGFWSAQPYYGFLNTFRYEAERVVLEKYTILQRDRLSEYFNWFAHYDVASLTAEVESAGLQVAAVHGDVAGEPFEESAPEFAVVVRLP